ncbi:hypothetical protein CLOM_g6143, partial [Closterium sp. NIES-68]
LRPERRLPRPRFRLPPVVRARSAHPPKTARRADRGGGRPGIRRRRGEGASWLRAQQADPPEGRPPRHPQVPAPSAPRQGAGGGAGGGGAQGGALGGAQGGAQGGGAQEIAPRAAAAAAEGGASVVMGGDAGRGEEEEGAVVTMEERVNEAQEIARRLDSQRLSIRAVTPKRANELHQPITQRHIISEVRRQFGIQLSEANVPLPVPLSSIGDFEVPLRFPPSVALPGEREQIQLAVHVRRK